MAVGNIDLNQEIESWKSAVYGKNVRAANVAAFEKIQGTVNDTVQNVNQAAEDVVSASNKAQQAIDSIQGAIITTTQKAAEAETSATEAASSQAAAASSKVAAAQSETNAAGSAEAARQIAEGLGGFDGSAISVSAIDAEGISFGRATGTGQVTVTDAWDAPVVDMEIDGASEQVTTTGAQLLDIKLPSTTTKSGVTISLSADGGIHLTGTATASGNHRLIDPVQNLSINCDSATLSLQASGAYDGVVMVSDAADGEWKNLLSVKNNATATGTAKTSKLGCYVTYVAGTTYNVTLYPMLCASPTALPWEPYTGGKPSPSPAYPQEIVSTDVTAVAVTGDNQSEAVAITLTKPLHGIDDVRDRIALRNNVWGIERRFGTQIFDGSSDEAWVAVQNTDKVNYRNGTSILKASTKANGKGRCSCFGQSNVVNSIQGFKIAGDASIITYSEAYNTSDVSLWTAYLAENPMTIVYELATPIWEPLPDETQTALNALYTYPGTTTVMVTVNGPEPDITMQYCMQPGAKTNVQSMLDVLAHKVALELISKSNIVNNLLATDVGTVLSGALGPIIDQRIAENAAAITRLNGESFIVRDGIRGNDDLNNIVVPGYYQLSSSASNSVANPAFRSTSIVEVITTDSYIVQRQTGPSESKYRFRDSNSNWGAWL
ncbi:hypothetical protein [[Clostridium] symbiosum]|uniref:hypothetical protein n=1 Tax=Clostridium symbiosum TaxID=1512 RepID=UPI00321A13B9